MRVNVDGGGGRMERERAAVGQRGQQWQQQDVEGGWHVSIGGQTGGHGWYIHWQAVHGWGWWVHAGGGPKCIGAA